MNVPISDIIVMQARILWQPLVERKATIALIARVVEACAAFGETKILGHGKATNARPVRCVLAGVAFPSRLKLFKPFASEQ